MSVTITALYAALTAALFVALSLRVILARMQDGIAWGEPEGSRLQQRVRAHGNFAEYAPMALVLLFLAEVQGAPDWLLHLTGVSLILGRLIHAYGLSERPRTLPWRVAGMVLTFNALGLGALGALVPEI